MLVESNWILCLAYCTSAEQFRKRNHFHLVEGPVSAMGLGRALSPVSQWVPGLSLLRTSCTMLSSLPAADVLWGSHCSTSLQCLHFTMELCLWLQSFPDLITRNCHWPGPVPLILLSSAPLCSARDAACRIWGWTVHAKAQHGTIKILFYVTHFLNCLSVSFSTDSLYKG